MSTLLEQAVRAHGGIDRWNTLRTASAVLDIGGAIWRLKGQPDMFREIQLTASLRHQQVAIASSSAGWRGTFTPDAVHIDAPDGKGADERHEPRASYYGHTQQTEWDRLHALGSVTLAEYVHKARERDLLFHAANGQSPLDH
ncbi:hypothetical protein [Burkholderia stagnalis]